MAVGAYALCTLNQVKEYLGISVETRDSEKDPFYEALIDRTSSRFEKYCDRYLKQRVNIEEHYDGGGRYYLYTDNYPITSISGIWDDSNWDYDDATLIDSDNYRIANNDMSVILKSSAACFNNYVENIRIIYTAGYKTVPDDIVQACVVEVVKTFKQRNDPHITRKSLVDGSSTRFETDFLPSTVSILNIYRNMSVV